MSILLRSLQDGVQTDIQNAAIQCGAELMVHYVDYSIVNLVLKWTVLLFQTEREEQDKKHKEKVSNMKETLPMEKVRFSCIHLYSSLLITFCNRKLLKKYCNI